ncbi:MAG: alpha/beta hydrolase family esterase [Burkholderiales bacterium]
MVTGLAKMMVVASIAGCALVAATGQAEQARTDASADQVSTGVFPNERIVVGGLARLFRLVVPTAANAKSAVPLVFAFHGLGDTKDRFAQYSRLDELAQKQGFVLVYPNARALFWPLTTEWAREDLAFFDALYAQLTLGYNIDPNRVFLIGNSNGAYFSHLLAMQRADRIAAIAVHSGGLGVVIPGSSQAAHKYAVFAVHGAVDPVVPVSESRRVRDAYQGAGHVVEYLEIAGHDHRWAGHLDVNTRMWTFLSAHPRR